MHLHHLEQAINERGEGRAFGKDQQATEDEQKDDNGRNPPFFPFAEEFEKLFDD